MKEKIVSERVRDNIFVTNNCGWMDSGAFYPPPLALIAKYSNYISQPRFPELKSELEFNITCIAMPSFKIDDSHKVVIQSTKDGVKNGFF